VGGGDCCSGDAGVLQPYPRDPRVGDTEFRLAAHIGLNVAQEFPNRTLITVLRSICSVCVCVCVCVCGEGSSRMIAAAYFLHIRLF
jgi:hypothetical protein